MSLYQEVTPTGEDYLRASLLFNNLTYNTKLITDINNGTQVTGDTPFVALNGFGGAVLQGQVTITSLSPSANQQMFTLPTDVVPARDIHLPIVVLRSGAYVPNAIKVNTDGTVVLKTAAQTSDVVCLDNVSFLVDTYS